MTLKLQPWDAGGTEGPILVRFTKDMVETLLTFFHHYQRDDVVTLQLTERGLWLVNPYNDTRQILGQAVLTEAQRERIVREHRAQRQKKVN